MQNFLGGVCVQRTEFFPRGTDFCKRNVVVNKCDNNVILTAIT